MMLYCRERVVSACPIKVAIGTILNIFGIIHTLQPYYNAPHHSAVFIIIQPCHGPKIDYSGVCL